jgi:hypothetical protein
MLVIHLVTDDRWVPIRITYSVHVDQQQLHRRTCLGEGMHRTLVPKGGSYRRFLNVERCPYWFPIQEVSECGTLSVLVSNKGCRCLPPCVAMTAYRQETLHSAPEKFSGYLY